MVAKDPSTDSFALAKSELWTNSCLSIYPGQDFDGVSRCVIISFVNLDQQSINHGNSSFTTHFLPRLPGSSFHQLNKWLWRPLMWSLLSGLSPVVKSHFRIRKHLMIVFTVEFSGFAATMVLISVTMVMISEQFAAALVLEELARLSTCYQQWASSSTIIFI